MPKRPQAAETGPEHIQCTYTAYTIQGLKTVKGTLRGGGGGYFFTFWGEGGGGGAYTA